MMQLQLGCVLLFLLPAVSYELFLRREDQLPSLSFLYTPVLTCIPESMDEAPSRFPEVNGMASSAKNKEPLRACGLIVGFDLRILLFVPFPWHHFKGSNVQKTRAGCQKGLG